MTQQTAPDGDLVVLTADRTMKLVVETLLGERSKALRIRELRLRILQHPHHDPGILRNSAAFLRPFLADCSHALVMFDYEGCGSTDSPSALAERIEEELRANGWTDRSKAICIVPELESCLWSSSPKLYEVLRSTREDDEETLRGAKVERDPATDKPTSPKDALEAVLDSQDRPWSASLHVEIAKSVGLARCTDPAFNEFKTILNTWFGAGTELGGDE